MLNVTIELV